jgi:hypothetical protein
LDGFSNVWKKQAKKIKTVDKFCPNKRDFSKAWESAADFSNNWKIIP